MRNNHNISKRILQKLSTAKSKEQSTISNLISTSPTSFEESKICEGRLVARVVPKQYSNYYAHKPMARVDPAPFISSLQSWEEICNESSKLIDSTSPDCAEQKLQNIYLPRADEESVVIIDLYLIHSGYLNHENDIKQQKDQQIFGMINSFDVTRNNSNPDNDSSRHDTSSKNLIHLHMNRTSTELASRTLQRLELSTARKLQSTKRSCKKVNRRKDESVAISSKLVLIDETEGVCREVEFSKPSSAELFNMLSGTQAYSAIVLTLPKMILPWNNGRDGEDDETIELGIISNPPTLLSIKTWENFNGDIFTCVPLVIETTIIHATRVIITWFVDEKVVLHDSNMYTPTTSDIGKHISILVTPIRPGHDGAGCQEAYSFNNTVQALPKMPIMELRKEWSNRVNTTNNLRVVTYNILADLYAGREIDQTHHMYGHCGLDCLARQRRMPMIVAELLSYHADIICLQEVDLHIYKSLLRPVLEACGYQGFFSSKISSNQEGCAMFWSINEFEAAKNDDMRSFPIRSLLAKEQGDLSSICSDIGLSRQSTHYYDAKTNTKELELDRWESINDIHTLFENHDEIRKIFREKVGQIVQVVRLRPRQSSKCPKPESILVTNTHLFYHPMADHVRLLPICHKLDDLRKESRYPEPILLIGDLNSDPLSGAVRLLTNRSMLPNENDTWKHINNYRFDECGDSSYMIDHGYLNVEEDTTESCDEEEFVDAESSLSNHSTSISDRKERLQCHRKK